MFLGVSDAFLFQTLFKGKNSSISWFFTCYLKMSYKFGIHISKFTKKLEIFTNWTIDGTQYTFHKNWLYVVPKFLKPHDFKTTIQKNLTCIFLSLRANLKKTSLP